MNNLLLLAIISLFAAPQWTTQTSGVTARLRGASAVSERVAWASGANSTVLRTTDGGATWRKVTVTSDVLDFRDIDAIDENTAYVLSIGNGPASRIYKTTDAGATWKLQFTNDEAKAFYDAMSFWDRNHGIVIGDSIDGKFCIRITEDGGRNWIRVAPDVLPPAMDNEGAFAASGTNIAVFGKSYAWIGTGAVAKARVLFTSDRGQTWKISETPLNAGPSAGIFSVAFRDAKHGIVVGGDYRKETEADNNLAVTSDGGVMWKLAKGLTGFRSVVAYVPGKKGALVAVGPSGADYSTDDGQTWSPISGQGFDTLSFAHSRPIAFAAGAGGRIGKLTFAKFVKPNELGFVVRWLSFGFRRSATVEFSPVFQGCNHHASFNRFVASATLEMAMISLTHQRGRGRSGSQPKHLSCLSVWLVAALAVLILCSKY